MNVSIQLPDEIIDEIVAEVTRRVVAELRDSSTPEVASPYMSIPEAAAILRCSRQRVDDLLSQGRLTRRSASSEEAGVGGVVAGHRSDRARSREGSARDGA